VWFQRYPCGQTDTQTHTHTYSSEYFAIAPAGEVIIMIIINLFMYYLFIYLKTIIVTATEDTRETTFLYQRLSIALQRGIKCGLLP